MSTVQLRPVARSLACLSMLAAVTLGLAACGGAKPSSSVPNRAASPASTTAGGTRPTPGNQETSTAGSPIRNPRALAPFSGPRVAGEGAWRPAGRRVDGVPAVYETTLVPPGGTQPAGIAWMDSNLLSARLYSGSMSPGKGPYRYTAPIQPAQAASLVAAFNGGFVMTMAHGGYYTEGRVVDPLVRGAASLVIYSNGRIDVGAWGSDAKMSPDVVSVRQNLVPLVADGQPTAQAASPDWQVWGSTCGATSCAAAVPGIEHQWRSGVGVTADGALVYVAGPALDPLQLAQLLVRAGVVRGMQLDINPAWTALATYDPLTPGGLAAPSNGSKLLPATEQGPWTFFEAWWARDFVTLSARPATHG